MPPLGKRRFLQSSDPEAARAKRRKVIQGYGEEPLDDSPEVAKETAACRNRIMMEWKDYFHDIEVNPDSVWLDLCLNKDLAKDRVRGFLEGYVDDSKQRIPILGPEETALTQTVTSAHSLLNVWRNLIAMADATVLLAKRREDQFNRDTWRLKWVDHTNRRGQGAVFEISKWIFGVGATKLNLCTSLIVVKVEVTAEDILAVANIVWERPDIIPCAPKVRLGFLSMLILSGIGGFRPKALSNFKFRQIQIAVIRDPEDRARTKIAVTIKVPIVKKKKADRPSKAKWLEFTVYFIPVPSICLASFVSVLAIHADAFDPGIDSAEMLLQRPNLENVDYLPLKWKEQVVDRRIFELDYRTFLLLWHQACIALGLRIIPRPYSLRVGTGMDLDGVLSPVLRNYVMSNTTSVFEESYQALHLRVNLQKQRFKRLFPGSDVWGGDELEQAMRSMSLKRDPNAPVGPAQEDLDNFEHRSDVFGLRERLAKAKKENPGRKNWNPIFMQLRNLIQNLSNQARDMRRNEYFERVDRQRALGQRTSGEAKTAARLAPPRNSYIRLCRGGEALDQVAKFIQGYNLATGERGMPYQKRFLDVLLGCLANQPAVPEQNEAEITAIDNTNFANLVQDEKHTCLLCKGRFVRRDSLTQHCKRQHVQKGTFDRSFPCPECRRTSKPDFLVTSASDWSNHVERAHGKEHAPMFRTEPNPILDRNKVCCPFCGLYLSSIGFGMHIKSHIRAGASSEMFLTPFPCRACRKVQGGKNLDTVINGCSAWNEHVSLVHAEATRTWYVAMSLENKEEHICLVCECPLSSRRALTEHCKTKHTELFHKPFLCPECCRRHMPDYLVTSASSWSSHIEKTHGKEQAPLLCLDPTVNETEPRCPFCGLIRARKGFHAHFRSHVRAGVESALFSTPFPCLSCTQSELGADDKQRVMIDGCSAWDAHVFTAHRDHSRLWTVGIPPVGVQRRREVEEGASITLVSCLLCDGSYPPRGIRAHFMKKHLPLTWGSISCVSCSSCCSDQEPPRVYTGITAWNEHIDSNHNEVSRYFKIGGLGGTQSSSPASELPPSTQTIMIESERRRTEGAATLEGSSVNPISLIDISWEIIDKSEDGEPQFGSPQQPVTDLLMDPILLEMDDRRTPESPDETDTPTPRYECDIHVAATAIMSRKGSESPIWPVGGDGEGQEKSGDDISSHPQIPPSSQQTGIDLSMIDPILLEMDSSPPASRYEPAHMKSTVIQLLDNEGVEGIYQVEALLAKWRRGRITHYLVKWAGFPHEDNTWLASKDINRELVQDFEANYKGNHLGVKLLKKRVRSKRVEYLVHWVGRRERENSWEKETTISRERIMDFESLHNVR